MAFMKAFTNGSGEVDKYDGTFTISDTNEQTIDVGFTPRKLMIYKYANYAGNTITNGDISCLYDADISTNYQVKTYKLNNANQIATFAVSTSNQDCIREIVPDKGFKWKASSSTWYGTFNVIAIK